MFTGTTLVIKDSHFEACFSGTSGGAINHGLYGQSFGSTTIINSNFVENDSVLGGAVALLCDSTDMHVITDSTFSRNVAAFMPSTESGGMGADLYLNYLVRFGRSWRLYLFRKSRRQHGRVSLFT